MSRTYIFALVQFLVSCGLLSMSEAEMLSEGIIAIISLATLAGTLYGRFQAGGISLFGVRK